MRSGVHVSVECVKLFAGIFLLRAVYLCVYAVRCTVHGLALGEYILPQLFVHTVANFHSTMYAHFFLPISLSYLDFVCLTLVVICILLSSMTLKTGITIKLQFVNCGVTRFQCRLFIPLILPWLSHTHTRTHVRMYFV